MLLIAPSQFEHGVWVASAFEKSNMDMVHVITWTPCTSIYRRGFIASAINIYK